MCMSPYYCSDFSLDLDTMELTKPLQREVQLPLSAPRSSLTKADRTPSSGKIMFILQSHSWPVFCIIKISLS